MSKKDHEGYNIFFCLNQQDKNLMLAKMLFFSTSMATVGWTRFQNSFYMDHGLGSSQIGMF